MTTVDILRNADLFGIGSYSIQEAARLLRMPALNISRWMKGYRYQRKDTPRVSEPLWQPKWPSDGSNRIELGFHDLIELRFVKAFSDSGVRLLDIRNCLACARDLVEEDYPFSTRKFRTDGNSIFLESAANSGQRGMLDLKKRQYVFAQVLERTFKDLDFDADSVVRWRPFNGKDTIVIDPERSFGQPIASDSGVPTIVLAQAVEAEKSEERVARLFEVSPAAVKDAVRFESTLGVA